MLKRVLQRTALRKAMQRTLEEDDSVLLLGEDIGVYGGAFQVTASLKKKFGNRIVETPISESGYTGVSIGLGLAGLKPIVEYMFMDFSVQALDQILNQAVKMKGMYNNQVSVPVLFRTPAGGYRGYGPTHSQSLENIFASVHDLQIVYPYSAQDYYSLFIHIVRNLSSPVMFIENKSLYLKKSILDENLVYGPQARYIQKGDGSILVFSYGQTIDLVIEASALDTSSWSIIDICSLKPLVNIEFILKAATAHRSVFIVIESPSYASVAEHLSYTITESIFDELKKPIRIISSNDSFIPARKDREADNLVSVSSILKGVTNG